MSGEQPSWYPFLDWYDIWAGYANYADDGRHVLQDGASGVRLTLQRPQKIGPFFQRERPWEACLLNHLSILYDEGRYRMWYTAWPDPDDPAISAHHKPRSSGNPEYVCYAESEDGLNWERPELGLCEYGASRANNILFPAAHFGLHSIFRDPTAADAERYKAIDPRAEWRFDGRTISKEEAKRLLIQFREAGDAGHEQRKRLERVRQMLRGAVSPDGIHWHVLEEPLLFCSGQLDTQNVATYDARTGRYVAYLRGHVGRRRAVRHCSSAEVRTGWSEPQIVFATDSQDPLDEDVYTAAYSRYPGQP